MNAFTRMNSSLNKNSRFSGYLYQDDLLTSTGDVENGVGQLSGGRIVASLELMLVEWHARDWVEV